MPRKRLLDTVLASAALGVIVLFAVLRTMRPEAQYSEPSTYDTGGNGYAALFDLLAREGVAVRRFQEPIGEFHQRGGSLVLAGDGALSAALPSTNATDQIDTWVRAGGTLFVLDATAQNDRRALGLPKSVVFRETKLAISGCGLRNLGRTLRAGGVFMSGFPLSCTRDRTTLLRASNRAVVVTYRRGKGRVVVAATPVIFGNRELGQHDNAALAYALFAAAAPVAFDERIYGYETGHTFWQVLPRGMRIAIVLACIAIALAVIGSNLPFAPPAALEPPAERDSSAYIASLARMLQRGGAAKEIVARLERQAQSVLAPRAPGDERAHTLLDQFQTLATHPHPGPREVLAAGRLFATVRKEYEW